MVPYVSTAAETRAAVLAMRYPPHGIRGVAKVQPGRRVCGDFEEYYAHAHERLVAVIQIETPEAVRNIEEIAAVDGADVLFVGPTDLSYNMGIRDQLESATFKETLRNVSAAAKKHGKAAEFSCTTTPSCRWCASSGTRSPPSAAMAAPCAPACSARWRRCGGSRVISVILSVSEDQAKPRLPSSRMCAAGRASGFFPSLRSGSE